MFRRFSACVLPTAAAALATLLALSLLGCAHDANAGKPVNTYPPQVNIGFRTKGALQDGTWYYMVFNFTAAPGIDDLHAPFSFDPVSANTRGKNWEMYIAYTRDTTGQSHLYTLQRPNVPTVLQTKAGATDCAVGDFNSDNINDIAIACKTVNAVQIIRGKVTQIYNTTYFEGAEDIAAGAGPKPVLLYAGNVSGSAATDLVVLYAGEGATVPFLRVLESDGAGAFTAKQQTVPPGQPATDLPLGGTPIDALLTDLNNDSKPDLAVLTVDPTNAAAPGSLRILTGDGAGSFTPGAVLPVGVNPVQLAMGHLDASSNDPVDLVVANRGTGDANGTGSSVMIFKGQGTGVGNGSFTAGTPLTIPGPCDGVAVGKYFGAVDDISVTYVGSYLVGTVPKTGGLTAAYLRLNATDAPASGTDPVLAALGTNPPGVQPNYMLALDTGNMSGDAQMSSVVLSGRPGSSGRSLYIQRSDTVTVTGTSPTSTFSWLGDTIVYQTELEPSRIRLGDLNKDGITDFIIPCPSSGGGDRICLYYGMGKSNYTSVDIYWTDTQPLVLGAANWLLSPPAIGPNSIQLSIDPQWFYDLARQAPYAPQGFNVNFMTATSGIDLLSNQDHQGRVTDILSSPVNVKLEHGFLDNEQNSPRAILPGIGTDSQNIIDWQVEVI